MKRNPFNNFSNIVLYIMLTGFITSCLQKNSVTFDSNSWRSDANGCMEKRMGMYKEVLNNKNEILSLTNNQLIRIMGNPDKYELLKRNQKFFIYNISPGNNCQNNADVEPLFLIIRFNAVGLSSEVFIQNTQSIKN